jgi:methanogenic corrinoid protein MtbC1
MDRPPADSQRLPLMVAAFTAALIEGDPAEGERVVREAIDAGLSQEMIDEQLVAPAMRRVGDLWERGEMSVAEEHLATDISYRVLALQREVFRVARRRRRERVMLAAVEGERHVMGLEMARNLLVHAGFDVRMCGADVPIESLRPLVQRHRPQVFGFTATMQTASDLLPLAIDEVRRDAPAIRIVTGGPGVPDLAESYWLSAVRNVAGVVDAVDTLLHRPSLN